jgi:hypothetical protein
VDPFTASLDMYQSGKYYLTTGSYVAIDYAGYHTYKPAKGGAKYVCVSPIFNGSGINPLPKPVNIQFWALVQVNVVQTLVLLVKHALTIKVLPQHFSTPTCRTASPTTTPSNEHIGWTKDGGIIVVRKSWYDSSQQYAPYDTVHHWVGNYTNRTGEYVTNQPVLDYQYTKFVEWYSEESYNTAQTNRSVISSSLPQNHHESLIMIVYLHRYTYALASLLPGLLFWPLWGLGVGLLFGFITGKKR